MIKTLICIECPKSCALSVEIENGKVKDASGAKCPKGIGYAIAELENPMRILTATVLGEGLGLKLVPVRTDKPIPKSEILRAAAELRKFKLAKPVKAGDTIVDNFLDLGVKLIASRTAGELV
jgi:CxxC motif-containing protein